MADYIKVQNLPIMMGNITANIFSLGLVSNLSKHFQPIDC